MGFRTNGSGEAMRIDSSGNLLVGTTETNLHITTTETGSRIGDGFAMLARSGGEPLYLNRLGTDGNILNFRKDGTTVGSIGVEGGDVTIGKAGSGLQFKSGDPSIRAFNMTTNSSSDNAVDLGRSNTRFKDLYLSGGIYLGGTGSLNKLDDYEEGTWTPTNAGAALTVTRANYTKVGRMVTVSCHVTANANTSGDWGGLPFTADAAGYHSGSVGYQDDTVSQVWSVLCDGGTAWTLRNGATSEQLASGKNLRMTLTYFTP